MISKTREVFPWLTKKYENGGVSFNKNKKFLYAFKMNP